jgi:hypothetical protein
VVESTWESREIPVLSAVVELLAEPDRVFGGVSVAEVAQRTELPVDSVFASLQTLGDDYVQIRYVLAGGDLGRQRVTGVTSEARRAVGQWPSADAVLKNLMANLAEAEQREQDPERKTKLRSVLDALAGVSRDVLTEVLRSAILAGAGIH